MILLDNPINIHSRHGGHDGRKEFTMKIKISYTTPYADATINGFVMAEDMGDYYKISRRQYNRALKNLTVGNVGPRFISVKPVRVI